MDNSSKIIPFETAPQRLAQLREAGLKLVQCHGTFDLVHPGHIVHFEEARALGDALVVTLTAERFVNKGPGRPFFNDELRARSLAALACVDHVVVVPHPAAVEAIECVRPAFYCKGKEYEDPANDVTGNIADDIAAVARCGGQMRYLGSVVFSSTKLINNHFAHVADETKDYCRQLASDFPPERFRALVEDFAKLKVLVVGDTIFDKYTYVQIQGLTSKNRILSGLYQQDSLQLGGALAIYRHVQQFCPQAHLATLLGPEPWVDPIQGEHLASSAELVVRDPAFTTIVKQRFVETMKRSQELGKIFSVNYIDPNFDPANAEAQLLKSLAARIKDYDLVLVADFGHGLMTQRLREFVQAEAPFLALNCQTNSYNHGYNLISQQYRHANAFSLDEAELMLDRGKRQIDPAADLRSLAADLGSHMCWLTRGASGAVGIDALGNHARCLRLESQVVDTIGAGDAFFSLAALAARCDLPIPLGTFLGQLAGAQAVKIVGNTHPISKPTLLKGGLSLLSF